MKLWLITRANEHAVDWDEYAGFVIRAESEDAARQLCHCGDEGKATWLDPDKSICVELTTDGEPKVVLADFNAG